MPNVDTHRLFPFAWLNFNQIFVRRNEPIVQLSLKIIHLMVNLFLFFLFFSFNTSFIAHPNYFFSLLCVTFAPTIGPPSPLSHYGVSAPMSNRIFYLRQRHLAKQLKWIQIGDWNKWTYILINLLNSLKSSIYQSTNIITWKCRIETIFWLVHRLPFACGARRVGPGA